MERILPSIASADQANLRNELAKIKGYPYVHIDVEDGQFLPNITFGAKTIKAIMKDDNFKYDLHLLCNDNKAMLNRLKDQSFEYICFHIETSLYPLEEIKMIKDMKAKAGLAFNFKTQIEECLPFVNELDYILIMTAEPDGNGDNYNPEILKKIKHAREILPSNIMIFVDGGLNASNLKDVVAAGADRVVMGRAIWNSDNPIKTLQEFNQ